MSRFVNYLDKRPNIVDERSSQQHVNDNQHHKAENIKSQATKLVILSIKEFEALKKYTDFNNILLVVSGQ